MDSDGEFTFYDEDWVQDPVTLFNWLQNKFNGGQAWKRPIAVPNINRTKKESPKEEFSDWPSNLLSIGTFGNKDLVREKQEIIQVEQNTRTEIHEEEECSSPDFSEFTSEEVGKLEKELKKLLRQKPAAVLKSEEQLIVDLPLDRFLNCPSSLEVDRNASNRFSSHSDEKDEEIDRTIQIILGRCKDICEKKMKKDIGKKSLSFLIKKMFVCRSGFVPTPSLRDTLQESRMEKLLRTLLSKKIYNPTYSRTSSTTKYIENNRHITNADGDEEDSSSHDKSRERSKWNKTDSDYIVLEI